MNTRQLQYIVTVAEEKSFSEAANKLMISQPSLSQYVQKLEKEIGLELFERTVPLKLTNAGESYVEYARKILRLEDELDNKLKDINGGLRGTITVAAGFLNSVILLPDIVKCFYKEYPDITIIIKEDIEPNLKAMADFGEVDMTITTTRFNDSAYKEVELFNEKYLMAVPKSMSYGDSGHIENTFMVFDVEKAKEMPLVLLNASTYMGGLVQDMYRKHDIIPNRVASCTSATSAYSMAKAGIGATLIPYSTYRLDYSKSIDYYIISDEEYSRSVYMYYGKHRYISNIMQLFIDTCNSYFENYRAVKEFINII